MEFSYVVLSNAQTHCREVPDRLGQSVGLGDSIKKKKTTIDVTQKSLLQFLLTSCPLFLFSGKPNHPGYVG